MKTYKFEEMIFAWGKTESDVLNSIFNKNKKGGVIIKFKQCKFNNIGFTLLRSMKTKLYFDDCAFHDTGINFVFGSSHTVVFKNCKFESTTNQDLEGLLTFPLRITGEVGPKSLLRFENCTGLTKDYFTCNRYKSGEDGECDLIVTNPKCTLSYMGLYQLFKDRVLSKAKEEVVYKKVYVFKSGPIIDSKGNFTEQTPIANAIVTLVIPKGVTRYGNRHGKCRCQYAIVREITPIPGYMYDTSLDTKCTYRSIFNRKVKYEVGKIITPDEFDLMPGECSNGIHYFYDKNDAMMYL